MEMEKHYMQGGCTNKNIDSGSGDWRNAHRVVYCSSWLGWAQWEGDKMVYFMRVLGGGRGDYRGWHIKTIIQRLTVRCWNSQALRILVATFGKIPRFFWFFFPFVSSSSSPVPSPLPILALLASPVTNKKKRSGTIHNV